jgi:type II secretory pathway pseudopilin PulG
LVVVAILSILMALLLPAVGMALASSRSAACQNNLHQFGVAYKNYYADGVPTLAVTPTNWTSTLGQFMGSSQQSFKCPQAVGADSVGDGVVSSEPHVLCTRWTDPVRDIKFTPGPYCQRTDISPGLYYMRFDSGYYFDWDDLYLEIKEQSNGTLLCKVLQADGAHRSEIYDSDGRLAAVVEQGDRSGGTFVLNGVPPIPYGMNGRANRLTDSDSRKVLILDYKHTIANVVGPMGDPSTWEIHSTSRHGGVCNVLFLEGSVKSMALSDLDPNDTAIHNLIWKPSLDTPK